MSSVFVLPICAFGLTLLLHLAALRLFPQWKLVDFPKRYGLDRAPVPYPTGIIAVCVFLLIFTAFFVHQQKDFALIAAIIFLAIFCFRDDRKPLPSVLRLFVQIIVALILFLLGTRIYSLTNPMGGVLPLDALVISSMTFSNPSVIGALFTVVWMLLTINALNWFDGIPGQVSLLSTIAFLTIGLLAYFRGDIADPAQHELAMIAFILAGIALAGLLFDFPPARVLMGDTGAMFFGLMLGTLTIYAGGKVATAFLVLGVPLIDSIIVAVRRLMQGKSALKGGHDHLHHLLLARGWSQRQVIGLTACIGTMFGATALFLTTSGKAVAGVLLVIIMVMLHVYASQKYRVRRLS